MSFKCDTCGETVANTFCRCACQRDPQTQAERIAELEAEKKAISRKLEWYETKFNPRLDPPTRVWMEKAGIQEQGDDN